MEQHARRGRGREPCRPRFGRPCDEHLQRGRRGETARRAADEAHRHRAAAPRRGGLRAGQVGAQLRGRAPGPAMSPRPPRPAWSARSPTGSPSPRSSATRSACPSRTPRSSPPRRTSWACRSASSSARTSSPRTSYGSGCAPSASAAGSARWLAEPEHADRVTAELSTALRGALTVLRDSDVQAVVGEAITRRADAQEIAPGIGKMLEKVVADGGHQRVVDLVVRPRPRLAGRCTASSVMDAVAGRRARLDPAVRRPQGRRAGLQGAAALRHRDAGHAGPSGARRAGPLPDGLRRRPPVRHGHPRAGRAAEVARCWGAARCRT